jgi:hypothetical protein
LIEHAPPVAVGLSDKKAAAFGCGFFFCRPSKPDYRGLLCSGDRGDLPLRAPSTAVSTDTSSILSSSGLSDNRHIEEPIDVSCRRIQPRVTAPLRFLAT